jgi:amino acid adenylation domain-containing protein
METPVNAGFWLSPQQQQVWTLQLEGRAFRSVWLLDFSRPLSEQSVSSALKALSERHEVLRTVYVRQAGMKFPFQAVVDTADPALQVIDLTPHDASEQAAKLEDLLRSHQVTSIGPEQSPVVAAALIKLGPEHSAVLLSLSAMAADACSLQVLMREFETVLAGGTVGTEGEEPLRYVQFSQWQNDLIAGDDENSARAREFWKGLSDTAPALALPQETKPGSSFIPQLVSQSLDTATKANVEALAKRLDASSAEILLSAWQALLWRLTGQATFKVGVVFDGREYDELRDAVGVIAKTIPVDARFDGDFRFREVVEHVRKAVAAAAEWQEYYVPGTGFGAELPVGFESLPAVSVSASTAISRVAFCNDAYKLKLAIAPYADRLLLEFHFDGSRLTQAGVERIAAYYRNLLSAAVTDPEALVARLPILDEAERRQLISDWNQTAADYPRDKCFHELFEAQAALTPGRPALRFNEQEFSYRGLNEHANRLAHFLQSSGVGPDSLVGLCVERSADMMVAVLGILKAGGAYVPLNPDNPKARLAQQLSGAVTLITEQKLLGQMPEFAGKIICLDRDAGLWADKPATNPLPQTTPENLVYVIYTSGSTGVPKGVAVRHRNQVSYSHFIASRLRLEQYPEGLHFGTVSTIGADLGNTCIYPALISGGCLHVISYEVSTDAQSLVAYSSRYPIDVLKIVPSHLQALLQSPQAKQVLPRKYLILGGETFTPKLAEQLESLGGTCEVLNHYGPTETTVGSLTLRLAEYDWRTSSAASIPIGRPIANTRVYILDALLQPVPAGVIGELYIAGDGVTAGYLNQPDRTDERFVRDPFDINPNSRMYRTGDLARFLPGGNVEFLGRGDDQVKIRGFRIELGEIESVLAKRPGVKQVVVLAREDERRDKRLLAYVVADREANNSPDELRAYLKEQLPEFMVPSAILPLAKIPLTPNGKVDRQALPEPEAVQTREFLPPKTPTEEGIAKIWQEVLRHERISADDNFFDLGGHSLLATQVVSRIREHFHTELPIRAMFDHPTIADLADAMDATDKSTPQTAEPAIVRVSRDAYRAGRS